MSDKDFSDPIESILIFGGSGHVGQGLINYVLENAPSVKLRLATSDESKVSVLSKSYPSAEVCVCSYYDYDAMLNAFEGMEAAYMITPDFTDEELATNNFINAAKHHGVIRHIVRLMGDPMGMTLDRVPEYLRNFNGGCSAAVGHTIARKLFNDSGLPVTFTSIAAYYMDDLSGIWYGPGIVNGDVLAEVNCHHMAYIDAPEAGEAAARIILRRDPKDIGADHILHNGIDCWDFHDVAAILSEELDRKITYQEGPEHYRKWMGKGIDEKFGQGGTDFMIAYFLWEEGSIADIVRDTLGGVKGSVAAWVHLKAPRWLRESLFRRLWNAKTEGIYFSDLENILQRKPKSLRQWIQENKYDFESHNELSVLNLSLSSK
ncbi:NmrA family NAD(P)-binding protein [Maricurvus nonylphenolicus]|uniref:NmrA family NAD(P)-binding protein n=1 Tax=Maricurvus nonylphenolicus TaxID=1008307 RepID=UPI0036F21010